MLFPAAVRAGLRDGSVTVAFRCWARPSVKAGSTLRTPVGVLRIDAVDVIEPADVTDADARAAGVAGRDEVLDHACAPGRRLHRIRFHFEGDDPRLALRADDRLDDAGLAALRSTLERWDRASSTGPWTAATLRAIGTAPGVVSTVLADGFGMERLAFKRRVRRLKELGLTESLEVGYRLSPRGVTVLAALDGPPGR